MPIDPRATGLLGLLGQPAAQQGFGARLQQGFANNFNLLATAGAGLLANRQNATRPMFDPQMLMLAQAADQRRTETEREREEKLQTEGATDRWLESKFGLGPEERMAARSSKDIMNYYLKKAGGLEDETSYFGTVQYGEGPDGNIVAGVIGNDGSFKPLDMGEGVQPLISGTMVDLGTERRQVDKFGRPGNSLPIDITGREAAQAQGKAVGEATVAAPKDIAAADVALDILDQIETHPARTRATGWQSNFPTVAGSKVSDFEGLVDQAKSGAFLTAIQQMRGMGALSNAEGAIATAAVTRMNTATSDEGFMAAVRDYRAIIELGRARAAALIGQQPSPQAPAAGRTRSGVGWSVAQ